MKKEGMMKLFREETRDSGTGSGRFNYLFLFIFLHSANYSQIPINGFCKYNNLNIDSGYTSLFQVNFNNDFYSDLLLFNPDNRNVVMMKGDVNGTFTEQKKYDMPIEISNIENIIDRNNRITGYVFVSRKNMSAGLIKFSSGGRPSIEKEIKLDSYPDYISAIDFNRDGVEEFLVSGSAFKGISIIKRAANNLVEEKVVSKGSYSRAIFSDISGDGYPDIAAYNVVTNSIDIFYNDISGGFYNVRSLPFESKIRGFRIYDIDLDGYDDIIIIQNKNIKIFFGDFNSSFSSDVTIKTDYQPDNFITADFNKDGLIDIAYLDKQDGIISILFSSVERNYHKEIIYIRKKGIERIIPYYSRYINGIAALNSEGELYTITNLTSISSEVNITAGANPSTIRYFDYQNDGITDFCYYDEFDQKLKIVTRNKEGIPSYYYSYPLFEKYSELIVESVTPLYKRFYCYTAGKKLIEILDADLQKAEFRRSSVYSPGNILDIKIDPDETKNSSIYIAFQIEGQLGVTRISRKDLNYVFNTTLDIAGGIREASFGKESSRYLYYWSRQNTSLNFYRITYNRLFNDIVPLGSVNTENTCSIAGLSGNLLNNAEDHSLTFIRCSNRNFTISASDSIFLILDNNKFSEHTIDNRNRLFYGEIRFNGLKRLSFYNPDRGKIFAAGILSGGRNITTSELANAPGVKSFFIKNMSFRSYHLVYTNSIENCITIVQL
jgi:effector-binding domain-containing protein